jgi:phytoene dehydrogenase-like protein
MANSWYLRARSTGGLTTKAAVIGSGPNGLSAAIVLAQAGVDVCIYEGRKTLGGAASTAEVTLPGFRHDLGSSIFPMGLASPFFRSLPLEQFGLRWIEPPAPLAHPLDNGRAVMLEHDLAATAAGLGSDGPAYSRLMRPLVDHWTDLCGEILGPVLHLPKHPLLMARFGIFAAQPATVLAKMLFNGSRARALFAGNAAHSVLPLERPFSAAVGLVLGAAGHAIGWPIAAGGAQAISDALAGYFRSLGGHIYTGRTVGSLSELEGFDAILCDISPRQLSQIAGTALPSSYDRSLREYRYGPGAFKVDWALSEPIPWRAQECLRAATVHLGGTLEQIAASERSAWNGHVEEEPFVLVSQPSLFDPTRAPEGKHTAWGYCHVPNGYAESALDVIEAQMERFAPGFRDCVLARKVWSTATFEAWNPNLVGGDLSGGAMTLGQLVFRPTASQYRTPKKGLYLCSASTPPGGGVHGMCGYHAARMALRDLHL